MHIYTNIIIICAHMFMNIHELPAIASVAQIYKSEFRFTFLRDSIKKRSLASISIPSPYSVSCPRWLRAYLSDVHKYFKQTLTTPCDRTEPFALHEAVELADDLRCLVHNRGLRFTTIQKDTLHNWIHALQLFGDSVELPYLKFRQASFPSRVIRWLVRPRVSIHTSVTLTRVF